MVPRGALNTGAATAGGAGTGGLPAAGGGGLAGGLAVPPLAETSPAPRHMQAATATANPLAASNRDFSPLSEKYICNLQGFRARRPLSPGERLKMPHASSRPHGHLWISVSEASTGRSTSILTTVRPRGIRLRMFKSQTIVRRCGHSLSTDLARPISRLRSACYLQLNLRIALHRGATYTSDRAGS